MDKARKLLLKLNSGDRSLTDEEAELVFELLKKSIMEKGRNFEKRGKMESLSLASDACSECGRPYY